VTQTMYVHSVSFFKRPFYLASLKIATLLYLKFLCLEVFMSIKLTIELRHYQYVTKAKIIHTRFYIDLRLGTKTLVIIRCIWVTHVKDEKITYVTIIRKKGYICN
jgi:hypothetical protein